jgi:mono/diheme cytochrome c family protein
MKAPFLLLTMAIAAALMFGQTLPDGPGKVLVETQCASCHGLDQVVQHKDTKDGWSALVDYMVSRGMAATDEEAKTMVEYLAKTFPNEPKPAKGKAK